MLVRLEMHAKCKQYKYNLGDNNYVKAFHISKTILLEDYIVHMIANDVSIANLASSKSLNRSLFHTLISM